MNDGTMAAGPAGRPISPWRYPAPPRIERQRVPTSPPPLPRLAEIGRPPQGNKPKLLAQVQDVIQMRHYSIRTEEAYTGWIKRFILFHGKRHPLEMGEAEITRFLSAFGAESIKVELKSHPDTRMADRYARRSRGMPAGADVLRRDGAGYRERCGEDLLPSHRRTRDELLHCRTEALGGQPRSVSAVFCRTCGPRASTRSGTTGAGVLSSGLSCTNSSSGSQLNTLPPPSRPLTGRARLRAPRMVPSRQVSSVHTAGRACWW